MTTDMPPAVQTELTRLLDNWSGALLSRSRITDDLLDLRAVLAEHPQAQIRVDHALANLPGQNVVTREWAAAMVAEVAESFGYVGAAR
jgi:hypothetical protein